MVDRQRCHIQPDDRVLDIGPGAHPHPRADVYLDRRFPDAAEAQAQRGHAGCGLSPNQRDQRVWYDGGRFPFDDHAFDYAVCSHVIEHVPADELPGFVSEMQRVARRGYLEFPSVFYELLNHQPVHHWYMNLRDGEVLLLAKSAFVGGPIHDVYRAMFYCPDRYGRGCFARYPELFFMGLEWRDTLRWRVVESFDELVTPEDARRWAAHFQSVPAAGARNASHRGDGPARHGVTRAMRGVLNGLLGGMARGVARSLSPRRAA